MNSKDFEKLTNEVQTLYNKYYDLHKKTMNQKDTIDGCLNRIAVSDEEEEVERYYNALINRSILEYKKIARECHNAWIEYEAKWDEWRKVKNNDK